MKGQSRLSRRSSILSLAFLWTATSLHPPQARAQNAADSLTRRTCGASGVIALQPRVDDGVEHVDDEVDGDDHRHARPLRHAR